MIQTHASNSHPTVSVVIPTYNTSRYISDAIDSVLAQTFRDFEVIVIDDGSTDNTRQVLEPYRHQIVYILQENQGVAAARNRAIQQALGEFVALLDADDQWLPDKLEKQLAFLRSQPEVSLLFGDAEMFSATGPVPPSLLARRDFRCQLTERPFIVSDAFHLLLDENFIPTSTVIVRKTYLDQVGGFDLDLPPVEDRDMWLRFAHKFPIACISNVLARKRTHDSNISSDKKQRMISLIKVLEKTYANNPSSVPRHKKRLASLYFDLGYKDYWLGNYRDASRSFSKSMCLEFQGKAFLYYLVSLCGKAGASEVSRIKHLCKK